MAHGDSQPCFSQIKSSSSEWNLWMCAVMLLPVLVFILRPHSRCTWWDMAPEQCARNSTRDGVSLCKGAESICLIDPEDGTLKHFLNSETLFIPFQFLLWCCTLNTFPSFCEYLAHIVWKNGHIETNSGKVAVVKRDVNDASVIFRKLKDWLPFYLTCYWTFKNGIFHFCISRENVQM